MVLSVDAIMPSIYVFRIARIAMGLVVRWDCD